MEQKRGSVVGSKESRAGLRTTVRVKQFKKEHTDASTARCTGQGIVYSRDQGPVVFVFVMYCGTKLRALSYTLPIDSS